MDKKTKLKKMRSKLVKHLTRKHSEPERIAIFKDEIAKAKKSNIKLAYKLMKSKDNHSDSNLIMTITGNLDKPNKPAKQKEYLISKVHKFNADADIEDLQADVTESMGEGWKISVMK